jgi:hypothetical protein
MPRGLALILSSAPLLCALLPSGAARAAEDAVAAAGAGAKPNTLTPEEKRAGWRLLFDGKTTRGWRAYRGKKVPSSWSVKDGVLTFEKQEAGDPKPGVRGDIVTQEQYGSFELALDWRISEGGNSGVMFHVQESEDVPWKTGPEMQVLDNKRHKDGQSPLTSAGACYGLYPPGKDLTRPAGEWNHARLLIEGNRVEHWLNGERLVSYELGSDDWNNKVAASKFKAYAGFGKAGKGHIDLQDHNDKVEYRNVKLRVIKPAAAAAAR